MRIEASAADFVQLAELFERAPDITREALLTAMIDADALVQGELQRELPRGAGGAGGLAGSIQREEHPLADNVLGLVYSDRPYAAYVELGTKPHTPPIQPLIDWVEARLGERGRTAVGIAHAIKTTIARRGTEPKPIWRDTYNRLQGEIRAKFDRAVSIILGQLAGGRA